MRAQAHFSQPGRVPRAMPLRELLLPDSESCPASHFVSGEPVSAACISLASPCTRSRRCARSRTVQGASRRCCAVSRVRAGHARHTFVSLCSCGNLRTACARSREDGQRNHDCGTAHGGECGQYRASPVYVAPPAFPSAFADARLSDNSIQPGLARVCCGVKTNSFAANSCPLNFPAAPRAWPADSGQIPFESVQNPPAAAPLAATGFRALKTGRYSRRRSSPPGDVP